jgi:MraZ protein
VKVGRSGSFFQLLTGIEKVLKNSARNQVVVARFKGEYEHAVDAKGRVSFPSRLRKYLHADSQDRFTILKGIEHCLYLYPEEQWKLVEERLERVNTFSREGRTVVRNFLRSADDLSLDNQYRLALPPTLSEWAGITTKAIFIGSGDRIEIWSPEALEQEDATVDQPTYQSLIEKVLGGDPSV